jgi:hypothetical protein
MRKFYLLFLSCLRKKAMQVLGLSALALALSSGLQAQSTWNGSLSSNVLTTDNWTPAVALTNTATTGGPFLTIPKTPLYPGSKLYQNHPTVTGAQNLTVRSLACVVAPSTTTTNDSVSIDGQTAKVWGTNGTFIVNLDAGYTFTIQNGSTATKNGSFYGFSGFVVNSGTLVSSRGGRIDSDSACVIVQNNGILALSNEFQMGGSGGYLTSTLGGKLYIKDNGKVTYDGTGGWNNRFTAITKGPQIIISENGTLTFTRQKVDFKPHIKDGKIVGGTGYYPVTRIDQANSITYLWVVPDDQLRVEETQSQSLTAGQSGSPINVVLNSAWAGCDPASFEWKYTKTSGSGYQSFSTPLTNDTITPNFDVSGTLYVVCQATRISDGAILTTDEVKFVVGSGKLLLTPAGSQYLRIGQVGAPITVTETGTSTAREWKYSTVSGGPYVSFATPETGATYTPNFNAVGTYYIQLESTIGGNLEVSKEVPVVYELWTAASRNIAWLGTSTLITDAANWNPIAHTHRNNLIITTGVPKMPIITAAGPDTVNYISVGAGASFTVNKPSLADTLAIRNDNQTLGGGKMLVQSGVVHFSAGLRLAANTDTLEVNGNGCVLFRGGLGLALGLATGSSNPTAGGKLIVSGNGLVKNDVGPYRVSPAKTDTFSRTFIKDNGQVWYLGNQIASVITWKTNKKLLPDTLTSNKLTFLFDSVSNYTKVWAFDTSKFSISPYSRQYVGRDQIVSFKADNTSGLSNLQWMYRFNIKDGKSIDNADAWTLIPGATGTSVDVSFPSTGDYFVACTGIDGSSNQQRTLNFGRVVVTNVEVTPADEQNIVLEGLANKLTRTAPVNSIGEWQYSTILGTDYQSFAQAATDTFLIADFTELGLGTYYVIYITTVNNDEAQPVNVYSNAVKINIVESTGFSDKKVNPSIVYPNPSDGNFKVNPGTVGAFTVQIVDVNGKVFYSKDFNQNSGFVPVTLNNKGVYVIKVISGKDVKVDRLIVK